MSVKLTTPRTTVGLVNGSCFVRRHSDPSSEEQPGSSLDIGRHPMAAHPSGDAFIGLWLHA
jgi:hypothetical protein